MPLPEPRPTRLGLVRDPLGGLSVCNFIWRLWLLNLFNFQQMRNGTNHAANLRGIRMHDDTMRTSQSERFDSALLRFRTLDNASRLCACPLHSLLEPRGLDFLAERYFLVTCPQVLQTV